jgi:hypothetical protein
MLKQLRALTWTPEYNVAMFALLLNYPWEFLQAPLYQQMSSAAHWDGIKTCSRAAVGDAVIALAAFWGMALATRTRDWVREPTLSMTLGFIASGVLITIAIERLALSDLWLHSWACSAHMPVVPGLGIGLAPLLQWVVLPPVVLWLVRR